jgi:hypothetical protein
MAELSVTVSSVAVDELELAKRAPEFGWIVCRGIKVSRVRGSVSAIYNLSELAWSMVQSRGVHRLPSRERELARRVAVSSDRVLRRYRASLPEVRRVG